MDEIPPRRFEELLLSAEPVNRLIAARVTGPAEAHDQHVVFRDPLPVDVDNVVRIGPRCATDALRVFKPKPIPISFDGSGRHQNGTSESS